MGTPRRVEASHSLRSRLKDSLGLLRQVREEADSAEGRVRERHRRILLSSITNLAVKFLALVVNLLVVRLALGALGKDQYGLWVAITSIVVWASLLDFGVLNGLVNAISEAHGKNDRDAVIGYVSTAFYVLVGVSAVLLVGLGVAAARVDWASLLSAGGVVPEPSLQWSIVAAAAPIVASFPLSIVRQIYAGLQKAYVGNLFAAIGSLVTLVATAAAVALKAGLPFLVLTLGIGPLVSGLLNLGYLWKLEMPWIAPRVDRISKEAMSRLLRSSVPLFFFQLGALLVNNTQPLLLAHLASLSAVADYSLLLRLCGFIVSMAVLSTSPFVPAFREAFERGDAGWVRVSFRRMVLLRAVLAAGAGALLLIAGNAVLRLWLGSSTVGFGMSIWVVVVTIIVFSAWGSAFTDVLTIMDRIWVLVGFVMLNGLGTVLLTVALVPRLSVMGALIAYGTVTILLWSWAGVALFRRLLRGRVGPVPPLSSEPTGGLW
jgi:O-antigen/teichoic acid export membrane protein